MCAWDASARPQVDATRPVSAAVEFADCFASPGPTGPMAAS